MGLYLLDPACLIGDARVPDGQCQERTRDGATCEMFIPTSSLLFSHKFS